VVFVTSSYSLHCNYTCPFSDLSFPVLPDLCKPSRPALPLTLLVYGGDRGAQAQLNLRSSQPKSLPQYLYSSKKMVLITHGHFRGNFPQPDVLFPSCTAPYFNFYFPLSFFFVIPIHLFLFSLLPSLARDGILRWP
jgi:hypothetical protein